MIPAYLEDSRTHRTTLKQEPELGLAVRTNHGLNATIIAYGYYLEEHEDGPIFSVLLFNREGSRTRWNPADHEYGPRRNYTCCFWQEGKMTVVRYYANIVEAADGYAVDYGMDV